ncbi:MAG: hypothetical protein EPO26_08295 [Chloroflexota bacterium]|nr:MAG: hypothetical protein EPO26_08295 [Chloroflexota bacterium]
MRNAHHGIFAGILVLYLAIGALYATRIGPYNAPDEPAHANYVRHVAETGTLPILAAGDWDSDLLERLKASRFPPGSDVSTIRYESHQPPLYYGLIAVVTRAVRLPERADIVAMRLATLTIGAFGLIVAYAVAWRMVDPATSLLAAAIVAFLPMRVAVTTSVSNDALVEALMSLALLGALGVVRHGGTPIRAIGLGAIAGAAVLTKVTGFIALPIVALAWAGAPPKHRGRNVAIVVGTTLVLVIPWIARGASIYGLTDPLGLRRHDEVVVGQPLTGSPTPQLVAAMAQTFFQSFWGQFGWMGTLMDGRVYAILGIASAIAAIGAGLWLAPWGGFWRDETPLVRRGFALAAVLIVGVAIVPLAYNLRYLQPQGRYVFPAIAAISLFAATGLRELIAPRQRRAVYATVGLGLAALDVVALLRFIEPDIGLLAR